MTSADEFEKAMRALGEELSNTGDAFIVSGAAFD